jgi:cytochrome P450
LTPKLDDFTPERLGELDYVEACILETMRLKPVAPLLAAQALRETQVGDVLVPAGTVVWGVMRHASLNERHFPEAAAFKPERWLADNASAATSAIATASTSSKRVAMPFGAGPRICPGRYLAMLEMKMALAMLLGRFEIDAVSAPGGTEPAERLSFTLEPVGLTMRLRERT